MDLRTTMASKGLFYLERSSRRVEMKIYKLYIAKPLLFLYLFMFGVVELVGIVGLIAAAIGKMSPSGPPVWVFLLLVVAVSFASICGYGSHLKSGFATTPRSNFAVCSE